MIMRYQAVSGMDLNCIVPSFVYNNLAKISLCKISISNTFVESLCIDIIKYIVEVVNEIGRSFDLYGFCRLDNERYVATRSVKIWEFTDYEHVLVRITEEYAADFYNRQFIDEVVAELVDAHPNHHQSYFTFVNIVESQLRPEDIQAIKELKYSKTFRLGLRGWCDLRLIVVDIPRNQIYTNKAGKEVAESYKSLLEL